MQIKQDPVTGLYCRSDGAVLMPPANNKFPRFRWTFGCKVPSGYCCVGYRGKYYRVHVLVCRAFHGLAPIDKPFVDHIDRCKTNNTPGNLHWTSSKENNDNKDSVDKSVEKYKVRSCDDHKSYSRAYYEKHRGEINARQRAYDAARRAEKKAQGLTFRKGLNGKQGWYPRIRTKPTI